MADAASRPNRQALKQKRSLAPMSLPATQDKALEVRLAPPGPVPAAMSNCSGLHGLKVFLTPALSQDDDSLGPFAAVVQNWERSPQPNVSSTCAQTSHLSQPAQPNLQVEDTSGAAPAQVEAVAPWSHLKEATAAKRYRRKQQPTPTATSATAATGATAAATAIPAAAGATAGATATASATAAAQDAATATAAITPATFTPAPLAPEIAHLALLGGAETVRQVASAVPMPSMAPAIYPEVHDENASAAEATPQLPPEPPSIHLFRPTSEDAVGYVDEPAPTAVKPSEQAWVPKPPWAQFESASKSAAELPDQEEDKDPLMAVAISAQSRASQPAVGPPSASASESAPNRPKAKLPAKLPRPIPKSGALKRQQATQAEDESSKKPKPQPEVSVPVVAAQPAASLQLFDLPVDWSWQDVQDLPVDWSWQDLQRVAASRAAKTLSGLQMPGDNGVGSLRCCIVSSDDSANIVASAPKTSDSEKPSVKLGDATVPAVEASEPADAEARKRRSRWSEEGAANKSLHALPASVEAAAAAMAAAAILGPTQIAPAAAAPDGAQNPSLSQPKAPTVPTPAPTTAPTQVCGKPYSTLTSHEVYLIKDAYKNLPEELRFSRKPKDWQRKVDVSSIVTIESVCREVLHSVKLMDSSFERSEHSIKFHLLPIAELAWREQIQQKEDEKSNLQQQHERELHAKDDELQQSARNNQVMSDKAEQALQRALATEKQAEIESRDVLHDSRLVVDQVLDQMSKIMHKTVDQLAIGVAAGNSERELRIMKRSEALKELQQNRLQLQDVCGSAVSRSANENGAVTPREDVNDAVTNDAVTPSRRSAGANAEPESAAKRLRISDTRSGSCSSVYASSSGNFPLL